MLLTETSLKGKLYHTASLKAARNLKVPVETFLQSGIASYGCDRQYGLSVNFFSCRFNLSILKRLVQALTGLFLLLALGIWWMWPRYPYLPATSSPWQAQRLSELPIINDVAGERGP